MKKPQGGKERVTEASNPETQDLDRLPTREVLKRIIDEDRSVADALIAVLPEIEAAAEILYDTLASGGRWFNLGAGTSGRLGLLDAAEIHPTFGIAPERVQAVLAGGNAALERAVEGAEDDLQAAARELESRGLSDRDTVLGISASGHTPFVLGGVEYAKRLGARTIGLTCAPGSPLDLAVGTSIVTVVGPEVIAGSTRMKGGLSQKMTLHALSTTVMVRLGRVQGNLMTGVRAVNAKLRKRSLHIIMEIAGCDSSEAEAALEEAAGSVEVALRNLKDRN